MKLFETIGEVFVSLALYMFVACGLAIGFIFFATIMFGYGVFICFASIIYFIWFMFDFLIKKISKL